MCDDFDDGFEDYEGDDFEGDHEGDGFDDGGFDNEADNTNDTDANHEEPCGGPLKWQDWMIIGPLSEDLVREKREKRKIRREILGDDDLRDEGP